jgi:transcriptional regulator with XRE-family HTH domain
MDPVNPMGSVRQGSGSACRREEPEHHRPGDTSDTGVVLATFIEERGLTQAQLAEMLGVDRTYVSKILSGARRLGDVRRMRQVARTIGVPPERFGLLPDSWEAVYTPGQDRTLAANVQEDVAAWRKVRMALNHRRSHLTKAAASLYEGVERICGTPLITAPGWMLAEPMELGTLKLRWAEDSPALAITGGEAASESCRPLMPHGGRHPRYCNAIRDIDPPSLFENRVSYRLLDLVSHRDHQEQAYGYTTYFDMVDVCEVVAHEIAAAWLRHDGNPDRIRSSELPFRALVGDPFDLSRRPVLPALTRLRSGTIRGLGGRRSCCIAVTPTRWRLLAG